jgi:hypothetical protein
VEPGGVVLEAELVVLAAGELGGVRLGHQLEGGVNHLGRVVRRNIRRHANGNARRAVDKELWQPRGQHQRLHFFVIVVRTEIDGLFVDVGKQ